MALEFSLVSLRLAVRAGLKHDLGVAVKVPGPRAESADALNRFISVEFATEGALHGAGRTVSSSSLAPARPSDCHSIVAIASKSEFTRIHHNGAHYRETYVLLSILLCFYLLLLN